MQVGTKQLFDGALFNMGRLNQQAARLQTEISTTRKIQTPSDDSVAFARITQVKRSLADETQFKSNVTFAASLLDQADTALAAMEIQVNRAREIALAASNDTMSAADRKALAVELNGILDTMVDIANTRDSRGLPLFGGATTGDAFGRDANGGVMWQGEGEAAPIPIAANASIAAADSGARLFGGLPSGDGATDIFAMVQTLAAALDGTAPDDPTLGDTPQAQLRARMDQGISDFAAATDRLGNARASVGARGARLVVEAERLTELATSREIERSSLEDADVAEAIARLQQTMLALEASQASFAKMSQMSLFDYIR